MANPVVDATAVAATGYCSIGLLLNLVAWTHSCQVRTQLHNSACVGVVKLALAGATFLTVLQVYQQL
jgi:hypothetical protein